jgi:lysophospholipase L1-like esterase
VWVNELLQAKQDTSGRWVTRSCNLLKLSAALGVALFAGVSFAAQQNAGWQTSWGSAQMQPYGTEVLPDGALTEATLRQIVHLSTGGTKLRLRFSNAFGQEPLRLDDVHLALRNASNNNGSIDASTDHAVTFAGRSDVSVPPGADYLSDAVPMTVASQADLVITAYVAHAPTILTLHAGARATSFYVKGEHVAEEHFESPQTCTRWYFLEGVETTHSGGTARSVISLGDSITDGHGSTTDGNDRWPDVLARRMAANGPTRTIGVVNEGIGGNHILTDGIGPNALARFDRDVLSVAGARTLIIMEGINDLGGLDRVERHPQATHDALVSELMAAFGQMVMRAHAHGIKVLGATLTPYMGSDYYHPSEVSEADRVKLNEWIRYSGTFDGVVDFDKALRDPAHPDHMLPAYDSGDHLHPGPAGYKRMGEIVPLAALP